MMHIALIGEQPMPVFMAQRLLGADVFVPVATTRTEPVARRLMETLREAGTDVREPVLVDAYDLLDVHDRLREFGAGLPSVAGPVVMNLTAGTKIMALAAYSLAAEQGWDVVYVSTERETLYRLRSKGVSAVPLDVHVSLTEYFRVHGFQITGAEEYSDDERKVALLLGNQAPAAVRVLETIRSISKGPSDTWPTIEKPAAQEEQLLRGLARWGYIQLRRRGGGLDFRLANRKMQKFFCGGWLEVYVAEKLRQSRRYQEVARGLTFRRLDAGEGEEAVRNEFDVVGISRGQLSIFSCKSGTELLRNAGKARPALQELEALTTREDLGIYRERWLITTSARVSRSVRNRAERGGIRLVALMDLPEFPGPLPGDEPTGRVSLTAG